jgi:hypothetical protein
MTLRISGITVRRQPQDFFDSIGHIRPIQRGVAICGHLPEADIERLAFMSTRSNCGSA